MPGRACPGCESVLETGRFGPLELDLCRRCPGVWFDFGELATLVRAGPAAVRRLCERVSRGIRGQATHSSHAGRCPVCRVPLASVEYASMPGVHLDACPFCQGFWLSGQALSNVGEQMSPRPPAEPEAPSSPARRPPPSPLPGATPPVSAAPTQPPPRTPAPRTPAPRSPAPRRDRAPAIQESVARRPCPDCGQPNQPDAAVCWACGGFMRIRGAGSCPACDAPVARAELEGVEFGLCQGCAGTWLEEGRLESLRSLPGYLQEELARRLEKQPAPRACRPASDYYCPDCRAPMFAVQLGMLSAEPVSTCPECGATFLERGRLAEVLVGRAA